MKEASECQLKGIYQDKNQQTAFVALQVLRNYCGVAISKNAIAEGFANVCTLTGLRGRWEILSGSPLTICDTGHNGHGIRYVAEQLNNLFAISSHRLRIVLGMVGDKDIDVVLRIMPQEAIYYFTQPSTSRALPAEQLQQKWQSLHPDHNANRSFASVKEAYEEAKKTATAEDLIFIGGSNYVVGELLALYIPDTKH